MPKFDPKINDEIKNTCDVVWADPKVPYPKVKFTKSKKAKSYIENAEKMFHNAVRTMILDGCPVEIPITEENKKLHTEKFWKPLGVDFAIINKPEGSVASLSLSSVSDGDVAAYVGEQRGFKLVKIAHLKKVDEARAKLKELTEQYNEAVKPLLGQAGLLSYESPEFGYINLKSRPRGVCFNQDYYNRDHANSINSELHTLELDFSKYREPAKY
jgi:hypothetical protein